MTEIKPAIEETMKLDPISRAEHNFKNLSKTVTRVESGEPLVTASQIISSGLLVEPFWSVPGDFEGDTYLEYINENPDFSLSIRYAVHKKLLIAQSKLPENWRLVLKAGYRPYAVQIGLLDKMINDVSKRYPSWTDEECLEYARTFVSDPRVGCPPHTTGGAVDLDVIDADTRKPVDMGCPPNTDGEIAYLFSPVINDVQQENRLTLLKAMLDAGFAPLAAEWWHFQYGETIWAAFYGHPETKYDIIVDKIKSK